MPTERKSLQLKKLYKRYNADQLVGYIKEKYLYYLNLTIKSTKILINEGPYSFYHDVIVFLNRSKQASCKTNLSINADNSVFMQESFCLNSSELRNRINARIAIVIHVYYIDLFEEIVSYLKNIPFKYSLMISVCDEEHQTEIEKNIKNLEYLEYAYVRVVENRGRDIAPMLVDFASHIKNFDYICHIHTKKSLYVGSEMVEWRQYLYQMLLGSRERVRAIISLLETNKDIGIIYPDAYPQFPYWGFTWLSNKGIAPYLLSRLGIPFDPDEYIDYPAGSMFWAKRIALEPLLDLNLKQDDFPEEIGQTDGTIHHTIERCFALSSQKRGLKYATIKDQTGNIFSYRCHKNFHQYISLTFGERLQAKLEFADAISLDLFDTLLIRPFANPDAVFDFLEEQVAEKYNVKNFRKLRKDAENTARARKQYQGDVKISEIYSVLSRIAKIDISLSRELLEQEVNTEIGILRPREDVIKLIRSAKASNKRIIIVTDTYLEETYLIKILSACGIDFYDNIYISCDIGKRKDKGDIWDYVLGCEDIKKNRLLHIGDNEHSDLQILLNQGFMEPVHIMKPSVLFRHSNIGEILWEVLRPHSGWKENLLYGMISNLYCSDPSPKKFFMEKRPLDDAFSLGFVVFGPIVFGFLSWLLKQSWSDGVEQLRFASRDGFLLNQAYKVLVDHPAIKRSELLFPEARYFYCSRRACQFAELKTQNDIPKLIQGYFKGTLRSFFEGRLNVSDMGLIENRIGSDNLNLVVQLPNDYDKIYKAVYKAFDMLYEQATMERYALLDYCHQEGLLDNKVGLVDLGYSGTIQKSMINLLGIKLNGYYFITNEHASEIISLNNSCVQAYFENFVDMDKSKTPISRYYLLMESILTSPEGQLLYFRRNSEGVEPILNCKGVSQLEFSTIERIHEGVLMFIKNMIDQFGIAALDIDFPRDLIQKCYELVATGDLNIGDMWAYLSVENYYCGKAEVPVKEWCGIRATSP